MGRLLRPWVSLVFGVIINVWLEGKEGLVLPSSQWQINELYLLHYLRVGWCPIFLFLYLIYRIISCVLTANPDVIVCVTNRV